MISPLDYFDEERGSILHGTGENLQQVPVVVVVDEDGQFLEFFQVLDNSNLRTETERWIVSDS